MHDYDICERTTDNMAEMSFLAIAKQYSQFFYIYILLFENRQFSRRWNKGTLQQ